jgi:hypothetical protein
MLKAICRLSAGNAEGHVLLESLVALCIIGITTAGLSSLLFGTLSNERKLALDSRKLSEEMLARVAEINNSSCVLLDRPVGSTHPVQAIICNRSLHLLD